MEEETEGVLPSLEKQKLIIEPQYFYLRVSLYVQFRLPSCISSYFNRIFRVFEVRISNLDERLFKSVVHEAVRTMFGNTAGSAVNVDLDLLSFDSASATAILRVHKKWAFLLSSA